MDFPRVLDLSLRLPAKISWRSSDNRRFRVFREKLRANPRAGLRIGHTSSVDISWSAATDGMVDSAWRGRFKMGSESERRWCDRRLTSHDLDERSVTSAN